jgi:hypothetical protein
MNNKNTSHPKCEIAALTENQRGYFIELWTVLENVRFWAELNGLELPACARPNPDFFIDRYIQTVLRDD